MWGRKPYSPPQVVLSQPANQLVGGLPIISAPQQIGATLEPSYRRITAQNDLRFSAFTILEMGHLQELTMEARTTANAAVRDTYTAHPAGPFNQYPQVQNAAIVSAASLNAETQALASSAAQNGLQGVAF